jgi:hypothetical protein
VQTKKNDSAFPIFGCGGKCFLENEGLSKREYFAAMALQGILSNASLNPGEYHPIEIASLAIEAADILIYLVK